MNRSIQTALAAALLLFTFLTLPAAAAKGSGDYYSVTLAGGVARRAGETSRLPRIADVADAMARRHGFRVDLVWDLTATGFMARMPEATAKKIARDRRVASVQLEPRFSAPVDVCPGEWDDDRANLPSQTTSPQNVQCADAEPANDTGAPGVPPLCRGNWGLDRVDATTGRDNQYSFVNNGNTVNVYIVDSGIYRGHREFTNVEVADGYDAAAVTLGQTNPPRPEGDCYGHGTHVAAIIGGRTFGIAKNVRLIPVRNDRVFTNNQCVRVPASLVKDAWLKTLAWIYDDVIDQRDAANPYPAVVNWSGANDASFAADADLQAAVRKLVENRIVFVQSAGNHEPAYNPAVGPSKSVCDYTFAGAVPDVIAVGGIDQYDGRWTKDGCTAAEECGSLTGSCIDVWAPASDVISAAIDRALPIDKNKLACRLSGTSMAAPHVAGVAALYLQSNPWATVQEVEQALRSRGSWGQLQDDSSQADYIGPDSDNVLLYSDTRSMGPDKAPVASFTVTCPGRQCRFNAAGSSDDVAVTSYTWRFGNNDFVSGATAERVFAANSTNRITLRVTDGAGHTDHLTQSFTVNADAPPVASFPVPACSGRTCSFDSSGSTDDQQIASRNWSFGDGGTATTTTATRTYAAAGTYTVTLTVTDNAGQTGTQQRTITVTADVPPPAGVTATASNGVVTIGWSASSGADSYDLERKTTSAAWAVVKNVTGGTTTSTTDATAPAGVVLYRVLAVSGTVRSAPSNNALVHTAALADDPVVTAPPYTAVRAVHITELRAAVNALHAIAQLQTAVPFSPQEVNPAQVQGTVVHASDFDTLRAKLNEARTSTVVLLPPISFRESPAVGQPVKASQLEDLRNGIKR